MAARLFTLSTLAVEVESSCWTNCKVVDTCNFCCDDKYDRDGHMEELGKCYKKCGTECHKADGLEGEQLPVSDASNKLAPKCYDDCGTRIACRHCCEAQYPIFIDDLPACNHKCDEKCPADADDAVLDEAFPTFEASCWTNCKHRDSCNSCCDHTYGGSHVELSNCYHMCGSECSKEGELEGELASATNATTVTGEGSPTSERNLLSPRGYQCFPNRCLVSCGNKKGSGSASNKDDCYSKCKGASEFKAGSCTCLDGCDKAKFMATSFKDCPQKTTCLDNKISGYLSSSDVQV